MTFRLVLLLWPLAALAQAADFADLPPAVQVERALLDHPAVRAARAGVQAAAADADRLDAGPHEFALSLSRQQRHDRPLDVRYGEHAIGIESGLRLPGKAATDAAIGATGIESARYVLGDAMHETARSLLAGWFDWRRAAAAVEEWETQVALWRALHEAVVKKVGAGETARLEAMLTEAQLSQAEAQLEAARARREQAAIDLAQQFPALSLPATLPPPLPQPIDDSPEAWRERILAANHGLSLARSEAKRGRLAARRLDADQLPDPTVGLTVGSERDGQERIVGVHLSIPLPGSARRAAARAGNAQADAAAAREALALARAEAEARRSVTAAQSAYLQWQRLDGVARRMDDNARLLEKAWQLGEGQFNELQQARRQAVEARLAATQSRLDASETRYRLLLDAHALWELDGNDAHTSD